MVVADITGVVKEFPVPSNVPPVEAEYQLTVPPVEDTDNVIEPGPQLKPGVTLLMAGISLMVAVTAVLAAVIHEPEVDSTQ